METQREQFEKWWDDPKHADERFKPVAWAAWSARQQEIEELRKLLQEAVDTLAVLQSGKPPAGGIVRRAGSLIERTSK
jgi:hypothetical protein